MDYRHPNLTILLFLASALLLPACSPVKGYPGPERPETELSIIETDTEDGVAINEETVDGIEVGYGGIAMLPGTHEYFGRAGIAEEPFNCRPYSDFNSSGFYECEKDRRKKNEYNDCDCFDYLTIRESCQQVVKEGNCRMSFKTKAGERYQLAVGMNAGSPAVRVLTKSNAFVASGKCDKDNTRNTTVERYVGSGRYTANQYGFYSCYGY